MKIQHLLLALTLPAVLALTGCETAPTTEAAAEPAVVAPAAAPVAEVAPVATPVAPVSHEHCAKHKAEAAAHDCKKHCAKHKGKKNKACIEHCKAPAADHDCTKHCAEHPGAKDQACAQHCSQHADAKAHECGTEHCAHHTVVQCQIAVVQNTNATNKLHRLA
jgi:hypothetical protein